VFDWFLDKLRDAICDCDGSKNELREKKSALKKARKNVKKRQSHKKGFKHSAVVDKDIWDN
jgi:hypothetical protein